jgi:hypothetical protein
MGQCTCHPEIDSRFLCMKHSLYLCEECLTCRDPEIYCKHRSACVIWFMTKRKQGWEAEAQAASPPTTVKVTFQPEGQAVRVPVGSSLLENFPAR